jgi:hypothetical protein
MPLTPADNQPDAEPLCVYFWMWDAEKPVRCCVTSDALIRKFGQLVFDTDKSNEELFITYRAQIEQAASLKYDRGNIDAHGVLVTFNDLA